MERIGCLTMSDYGLRTDDIRYFKMDSIIRGRGPERLKYLDLEGRWVLNGKSSIPFISAAFNHLEKLNDSRVPFRDITDQPLNAIGMVGWTKSSVETEPKREKKTSLLRFQKPPVVVEDEVPPSPREDVPHRSYGYGPAHQKRKLSIPDRSRSASPRRSESPYPEYDKYAKYHRKDSMTSLGGRQNNDGGYISASPSPRIGDSEDTWVPPHRTQALSPRINTTTRKHYDSEYDGSYIEQADRRRDELAVNTKFHVKTELPYRTHGYGAYSEKRKYDISPRSIGSMGEDSVSGSEQGSPNPSHRNAEEVLVMAYHMSKGNRAESPRVHRRDWVRNN